MRILIAVAGLVLLCAVLWDVFETILLPRRVTRQFRITRTYYRYLWWIWARLARLIRSSRIRQSYLSYFGPLSLLLLFAVWVAGMILSFGLLQWAAGSAMNTHGGPPGFASDIYLSGTTFFTLGIGDVTPRSGLARFITVIESGAGFGILAIVISYLPVIYGAFSRREVNISLMDARAGSPPAAAELLRRHAGRDRESALADYLRDWEVWAAELMESHLSYPVVCFFRSQHSNQSWVAGLTSILDATAFLTAYASGNVQWQAQLTFAMARHAVVDLALVVSAPPRPLHADRLPAGTRDQLRKLLAEAGMELRGDEGNDVLARMRLAYEPYVNALSERFFMPLPAWISEKQLEDNWQRTAWDSPSEPGRRGRGRRTKLIAAVKNGGR